jgi:hypothetical protein
MPHTATPTCRFSYPSKNRATSHRNVSEEELQKNTMPIESCNSGPKEAKHQICTGLLVLHLKPSPHSRTTRAIGTHEGRTSDCATSNGSRTNPEGDPDASARLPRRARYAKALSVAQQKQKAGLVTPIVKVHIEGHVPKQCGHPQGQLSPRSGPAQRAKQPIPPPLFPRLSTACLAAFPQAYPQPCALRIVDHGAADHAVDR